MKTYTNSINTLISLGVIAFLATVILFTLGLRRIVEPRILDVGMYCLVTQLTGVVAGYFCAVAESYYRVAVKALFLYNFIGTLNMCLGLLGIVLFNLGLLSELKIILLFIINLAIGIDFLVNIYRRDKTGST